MAFYAHIRDEKIIGVGTSFAVATDITDIEISEENYTLYKKDSDYLIYNNGEVVVNPNYQEIKIAQRKADFERRFFQTHLGYVRREVKMKNGAVKDFLTDLLSSLQIGLPVLVYELPDFNQEVTEEDIVATQQMETVDTQFIEECKNQFAIDFYGFNPMDVVTKGGN